ncbi:tRNA selenocysteine 1-associated protein 1-like [Liolophura sinensis]|uniref:tRNA selenocysteine 1-associated protein 1-like n=1 Tax=Liolophura sinensis TaxID=3198878 RepID=UPI00315968CB
MSSTQSMATVWIGNLDVYMDELFITQAFAHYGEVVFNVKLIRNKHNGQYAGYGFVEFSDADAAQKAISKLSGKIIPNSSPPKRFKLNNASHSKDHMPEFSLFVGDLSEDVDNYMLYDAFAKRYRSCRAAKVVYDNTGKHKGYGFVRFSEEHDLHRAVKEMQHMTGIGRNPIRVGPALHKNRTPVEVPGTSYRDPYYSHYSQHYPPYNSYYGSWTNYSDQYYQYPYPHTDYTGQTQSYYDVQGEDELESLEDPCLEVDVEKMNKEFVEQSEEFYSALESSRWYPLDSASSQITPVSS